MRSLMQVGITAAKSVAIPCYPESDNMSVVSARRRLGLFLLPLLVVSCKHGDVQTAVPKHLLRFAISAPAKRSRSGLERSMIAAFEKPPTNLEVVEYDPGGGSLAKME